MFKRTLIVFQLILSLTVSTLAQTPAPVPAQTPAQAPAAPLDKQAAKIRSKVEGLGIGHQITVKLKNGDDYHGAVSQIDPTSFAVAEVDLRQGVKFYYSEVKKVRGDYGPKNVFGNRINPKTQTIVAIGVLGGLIALIGVTLRGLR
jgi:small nuclear ribonucleoprotein (snRNP)-like protein